MEEWYTADEIWSSYTTSKTREAYAQNWVVRGYFHAGVPEDVKAAYVTVEYLMALAWYHYPLYDEAMTKLLLKGLSQASKHVNSRHIMHAEVVTHIRNFYLFLAIGFALLVSD